jgi:predicted nucleic acid-binding protein
VRVLIDTNVVFNVFERRQPDYSASNHILKLARHGRLAAAVASQTVANCFSMYRKAVLPFVRDDLLETLDVAAGDAHQVKTCLNLGIKDPEDALQVAAAMDWKASFIITGNVRDFKRSPIPALAPAAWIKRFEPHLGN